MTIQTRIAQVSSIVLRVVCYFFLRWAPLPQLAPLAFTLFVVYVPTFVSSYLTESSYEVVSDEAEILIKESALNGNGANGKTVTNDDVVIENVEVKETIAVGEKPARAWQTLLTGVPNPRSLALSALTLLLNVACVTMVADRVFTEHLYAGDDLSFIRVGYVSDRDAKLLVREPDQAKMPISIEIRIKDPEPPFDNPIWQTAGGIRWTTNETDFTAVVTIPLRHTKQRRYEWKSSNGHFGEFTSAPKAGQASEKFNGKFTFVTTSCIVSRLPYNPLDHPLTIPGMRYLADVLPSLGAQFMLFLGDFIYIDVPKLWGVDASDYRQKYRQVYSAPEWPTVGQNLSWIHVLDDHEIKNDWSANSTGVYKAAVDPWHHYHTAANPPQARQVGYLSARGDATWFEFSQGPASFFMMDTRSYRSNNFIPYTDPEKTMLGAEQLEDFLEFLKRPEPNGVKWKIIASSVPFTKNWPINTQDTWGGFLVERKKILETMWDTTTRGVGVVVLSGDRHEFAATKFPPPEDSRWSENATVYEFSASPLSQFYSPIPTYRQTDKEDVQIKYVHNGHSKFGAITMENLPETGQGSLQYRLFVDGVNTWNSTILSPEKSADSKSSGAFWERWTGSR